MRHNGRPIVLASELAPNLVNLHAGERPQVACAECGRWTLVRRGIMFSHRAADGVRRCVGSGQRIRIDLSTGEWLVQLRAAEFDAACNTGGIGREGNTRVFRQAKPPTQRAVHQIAASR